MASESGATGVPQERQKRLCSGRSPEYLRHFVDCILNNRESHANLEDAALTHEICFASQISAREKRPVGLPL